MEQLYICNSNIIATYMTRFVKTVPNGTTTIEIKFIA